MVGIVIVSHSAKLAEGVCDLAVQMGQGSVSIAVAGGIDDPENPMGTDAVKVHAAIEAVYSPDGVVVLVDLGSALLSADMALEFLTPDQQEHVHLCSAPLVEGALAAAVQASLGSDIEQVLAEASGALAAKISQFGFDSGDLEALSKLQLSAEEAQTLPVTVRNTHGLHARPAAKLVKTAGQFQADLWVIKENQSADAKSINQVVTLGVRPGEQMTLKAIGLDAAEALAALNALADENFGETEEITDSGSEGVYKPRMPVTDQLEAEPAEPAAVQTLDSDRELIGIPASPGTAGGPVFHYKPKLPRIEIKNIENPAAEWTKLETALTAARREIRTLHAQTVALTGSSQAAIFEAHQLFLIDPDLLQSAKAHIFNDHLNAEAAWQRSVDAVVDNFLALDDAYLRGRAGDVRDVGDRVLRHLLGLEPPDLDFEQPVMILAVDLTPSDVARLTPDTVLGICTAAGGKTSHSVILARALDIPAVVGLGDAIEAVPEGQIIALDGSTGRVWLHPDEVQLTALEAQRVAWQRHRQQVIDAAHHRPAVTEDGRRIGIMANISGPDEASRAMALGAEGVGLFRTEFLFMGRTSAPTEEEQFVAYRQVFETMGRRPVIIRTLDVGGDKPLSYLDLEVEANPFLGWRGLRFCLDQPGLFKTQLRAILRAGAGYTVRVMFPMVSTVSEFRRAKQLLAEVQVELGAEQIPFAQNMAVGVMIEVPSAVVMADQLAAEADFFSIGSNDLAQYVLAADRGNRRVAKLVDALQPAVLRMIKQTVQAAHAAGIRVGLCGELAGDPLATPVLVGLEIDELSMSPPAIPQIKTAVRHLTVETAQQMAHHTLTLESAEAVNAFLL